MRTEIEFQDGGYALLTAHLSPNEQIQAEPGAMVTQTGVDMTTGGSGGILRGIKKSLLARESFFLNTFTAGPSGGQVSLAPPTPGDIGDFPLDPGQTLLIQSGSFLACTQGVVIHTKFQGLKGLFSGEGLFFLAAYAEEGHGQVFYNSYGAIKTFQLEPDRELVVDTGHVVAFTDDVEYTVGKVGNIRSFFAGGEGMVMKFTGTGHVWVQTRNLASLAEKIAPFLRHVKSSD